MGGNECQRNQSKEESMYILDLCEYINVTVFTRIQNYCVISHNRETPQAFALVDWKLDSITTYIQQG